MSAILTSRLKIPELLGRVLPELRPVQLLDVPVVEGEGEVVNGRLVEVVRRTLLLDAVHEVLIAVTLWVVM